MDDFDNMIGDLDSVIKDLESFNVPTRHSVVLAPPSTNTVVTETHRKSVGPLPVPPVTKPKPQPKPKPSAATAAALSGTSDAAGDFDLDSLLTDLDSFNPTEVVAASHSSTSLSAEQEEPHTFMSASSSLSPAHHHAHQHHHTHQHSAQSASSSSQHSTPAHNHQQVPATPPDTPGHAQQHLRSYTEVGRPQSIAYDSHERQKQEAEALQRSYTQSQPKPSDEMVTTTVPQPVLEGATDRMSPEEMQQRLEVRAEELRNDPNLTEVEREEKLKEEKMRIALEKMKIAHKKKVAIKVFNADRSNKTVVVEEGMTSSMVCHLLVVKNHFDESPNWVLVEQLQDISLERELEDHESVVDVYSTWPRENNNVFLFRKNTKKYNVFEDPMKYFPSHLTSSQAATSKANTLERAEKARKILMQEYFSTTSRVPELEGFLHIKDGYNKRWKKTYFILRASGLYYSTKGKQKSAKHLALLVHFIDVELYHGINFKKTLKSPSDFCFALRPIPKLYVPGPADVKVLCADDDSTTQSWIAGIRLAKYGSQLRDNYYKAKMTQFKLEDLSNPDGSKPKAEERSKKLVGLRLEKHLDKLREQYKVQKQEEEERRMHYHSPQTQRREGEGEDDVSMESGNSASLSHTPEHTPDASPMVRQRAEHNGGGAELTPPPVQQQQHGSPLLQRRMAPYNPYPPPSQPAPPPLSPQHHTEGGQQFPREARQQSPLARDTSPGQRGGGGMSRSSSEHDSLYQFPWYHGSIPREEAIRRLEKMGGFDGCFLVRDSSTVSNSFVLTMFAKGVAKNFQILNSDHGGQTIFQIDDGPAFPNVEKLIQHYKKDSDRLPCHLMEFCPRPPTRLTEC